MCSSPAFQSKKCAINVDFFFFFTHHISHRAFHKLSWDISRLLETGCWGCKEILLFQASRLEKLLKDDRKRFFFFLCAPLLRPETAIHSAEKNPCGLFSESPKKHLWGLSLGWKQFKSSKRGGEALSLSAWSSDAVPLQSDPSLPCLPWIRPGEQKMADLLSLMQRLNPCYRQCLCSLLPGIHMVKP